MMDAERAILSALDALGIDYQRRAHEPVRGMQDCLPIAESLEAEAVTLLIDRALKEAERLAFHPNDSACTLALAGADFYGKFLPSIGKQPRFITI